MASSKIYLKSYESFLEKIVQGSVATNEALKRLRGMGHKVVPLEKGTLSFKVWVYPYKCKRFRVPDLICLRCATSFEVRAKTSLEISMSHSGSDEHRAWDYGLEDGDYIIFVGVTKTGEKPIDYSVDGVLNFANVGSLRGAFTKGKIVEARRKGREEGFEKRIIWPTRFASANGTVVDVNDEYLKVNYDNSRKTVKIKLKEKEMKLIPLVRKGDRVAKNQAIASVVPDITTEYSCTPKSDALQYFVNLLNNPNEVRRYIGAKVLRYFPPTDNVLDALARTVENASESKFVRIEAAVSLLELGDRDKIAYNFLTNMLKEERELCFRNEVILSLAEVKSDETFKEVKNYEAVKKAYNIIKDLLFDKNQDVSTRAVSAWALGELHIPDAVDLLVEAFDDLPDEVKKESARALLQIVRSHHETINNILPFFNSDEKKRPGIAWVLMKYLSDLNKYVDIHEFVSKLTNVIADDNHRYWISYILGMQKPSDELKGILPHLKDEKLFFGVNLLWTVINSWVWGLEEW